jgi:hypothetical protein
MLVGIGPVMSLNRSSSLASVGEDNCETQGDVSPRLVSCDFLTEIPELGDGSWHSAVEKIRFQI